MKALIIDNHSLHTNEIPKLLRPLGIKTTFILEWDVAQFSRPDLYDMVVFSGAQPGFMSIMGNEHKLVGQLDIARTYMRPLIGVCYGCQIIAHAFGAVIEPLPEPVDQQIITVTLTDAGRQLLGDESRDGYSVYASHKNTLHTVPDEFIVLAESQYGPEIIIHRDRPILGTMFHPECHKPENDGALLVQQIFQVVITRGV